MSPDNRISRKNFLRILAAGATEVFLLGLGKPAAADGPPYFVRVTDLSPDRQEELQWMLEDIRDSGGRPEDTFLVAGVKGLQTLLNHVETRAKNGRSDRVRSCHSVSTAMDFFQYFLEIALGNPALLDKMTVSVQEKMAKGGKLTEEKITRIVTEVPGETENGPYSRSVSYVPKKVTRENPGTHYVVTDKTGLRMKGTEITNPDAKRAHLRQVLDDLKKAQDPDSSQPCLPPGPPAMDGAPALSPKQKLQIQSALVPLAAGGVAITAIMALAGSGCRHGRTQA